MAEQKLIRSLADVRRRLVRVSLACGAAWGLVALLLVLIVCAWVDLALDLPSTLRLTCSLVAIVAGLGLVGWAAVSATRNSTQAALARRLDGVANSGGQILSGVDLFQQFSGGSAVAVKSGLSNALARMAIERAASLADGVAARNAVPAKPLAKPLFSLGGIVLALGIVGLISPRLFATQWSRFTDPFGDHLPYSAITFDVQPGNTSVLYGSGLDIRAKTEGGVVEQLDLVLVPTDKDGAEDILPMFPEPGGAWRATVADVTTPGQYFVRTRGARSTRFSFGLITVPEIKDVKFRLTPPAYTRLPAYEGPLPQNGLAGLPGTKVEVWAKSNRPLSAGRMVFTPAADEPAAAKPTTQEAVFEPVEAAKAIGPVEMTPIGPGAAEVSGAFTITRAGKIDLTVSDVSGQTSKDTFSASVGLLHDDRPFVRIMQPLANSYATPDVSLPIVIRAEDDYGVTRVQLFRALNGSRPLGMELKVPDPSPTQLPVTVELPLAQYGLVPGDVIKLFARVEDNDPAGAKGTESAIVTVQIISKQDLNRLTLAREGMEVFQAKYDEARRLLEQLNAEAKELQEELKDADPNSEMAKDKQQQLKNLAEKMQKAADEIAENAKEDLPFDLDANLRSKLQELSDKVREAGEKAEKKAAKPGLNTSLAGEILREMQETLGGEAAKKFEEEVTTPLELLAKVFPLKEDEMRFTDLYLRQKELAERMAALKANAGDDPQSKARMRDLEAEQRRLREDLRDVLNDIEDHTKALPDTPELADLKATAEKLLKGVRESTAADEMQASEVALSEFKGVDAAQQAKNAADTLAQFIGSCQGMGEQAQACLKFSPSLSSGLGSTVDQLLEAQGMKPGTGMGGGGGYSARRSTLSNVGLYGNLPRMSRAASAAGNREGKADRGGATRSDGNSAGIDDPAGYLSSGRLKAAGESGTHVPAQYRTKVGQYFQRVADELGEE